VKTLIALAAALALALPAAAAPLGRGREAQQQQRIRDGVHEGDLTRHEAHSLRQQQRHIDKVQHRAGKDGTVTRKEARRIDRAQDQANRNITRQKHDRQQATRLALTDRLVR
jgi:hypothetical protein